MNRFIALIAAGLLAVALAAPAAGAPTERGPKCADITAGVGNTAQETSGQWTLTFQLTTAAPSCKQVSYTLVVLESGTDSTELARQTVSGDGSLDRIYSFTGVDDDDTVCVYAETASNGGTVFDRAPDTGCMEVSPNSGGQQFR